MDKFKNLLDKLKKAATGEGSRGGEVIGHTKSGKPIYASSKHEGHQEFGSGEHRDAMNHHYEIWSKTQQKIANIRQQNPNWNPPQQIHDFLKHHYTQMQMHQSRMGQAEHREKVRGAGNPNPSAAQPAQQGKKFEPLKYAHMSKAEEIVPFYAATIMIDEDGKNFLLGKRLDDGLWTSPAGGAKVGEMPKRAAIREAFEEANVVIDEGQMTELPMGYAHNNKPVHCYLVRLNKEQMEKISPVNDPDKEVRTWKWFPIDEKMPEPIDDNRFKTLLNAKMHLAGIIMKSYYNLDDMEGMTSINATEQAVGNSHDDTGLKQNLEKLMSDFKPGDEPVRVLISGNHVLHLVRIDDGVFSGFVKKNEADAYKTEVENVLTIDKMTISDLVELMRVKGITTVPEMSAPVEAPKPMTSEQVGQAYASEMDRLGDVIAEQEREAQEKADFYRLFPQPQTRGQELILNMLVEKLWKESRIIQKAKALPVGTVRQWGPYKYVKHQDGWVVIGGDHHGKLMGDFKSDAKYGDYARHHQNSSAKQDESKQKPEPKKEDASTEAKPEPKAEAPTPETKPETAPEASEEQTRKDEISKFEELGKKAFADGKKPAPAQNAEFMKLMEGKKMGDNLHLFDAYIKGWHSANLAAPVPNVTPKTNPDEKPKAPTEPVTLKESSEPKKGTEIPKEGTSAEPELSPEQEEYIRKNAVMVQRAMNSKAHTMSLKEWMDAGAEQRRQDILAQNLRPGPNGEPISEERKKEVERSVNAYMERRKRTINKELKEQHRKYTEAALMAGLKPSEKALKEYPGLGGTELPEGMDSALNEKTNMVKAVDFGSSSKIIKKKFAEHLNTCNKLVDGMNIRFKTPLTFRAKGLGSLGKRVRGSYIDSQKVIELNDLSNANKTLMHEIGHALDYAMSETERGSRGRHKEMLSTDTELGKVYSELHDVVTQSDYYTNPEVSSKHKQYLRTPTEVFARAFEVYSLAKAEELKLGQEFIDTFVPDVFKTKDEQVVKLREEIKTVTDEFNKKFNENYTAENREEVLAPLREKLIGLRESYKERIGKGDGWTTVSEDKQKEYKMKVSELMEKILKDDQIRKALEESHLAITLQKSEGFQKAGGGLPVGSVRLWGGKKFIKHGDGHWAPLPDGAPAAGQQQPQAQAPAAVPASKPEAAQAQGQESKSEAKPETQKEEKSGPLDHLKPEKHAGGHISIHSKDFAEALKNGPISIISAGVNPNNPEDRALTDQQVGERYKRLEQDLKDHGYKYTKVKGHYGGEEDSFIVFHADENHMNQLGEKYNQDSVIHAAGGKNKLHFTTGDNKGKHHKGDGHEEVPDAKDYYSVVKTSDGVEKKFSLGLDFGKLHEAEEKKEQAA